MQTNAESSFLHTDEIMYACPACLESEAHVKTKMQLNEHPFPHAPLQPPTGTLAHVGRDGAGHGLAWIWGLDGQIRRYKSIWTESK